MMNDIFKFHCQLLSISYFLQEMQEKTEKKPGGYEAEDSEKSISVYYAKPTWDMLVDQHT